MSAKKMEETPMEPNRNGLCFVSGEKGVESEKYGIYTSLLNFLPWVRSVLIKNVMVLTFDKPSYLSHQF